MSEKKFHVINFGCRTSQSEGSAIHAELSEGASPSTSPFQADVLIVNSCTVTENAEREARRLIRRVGRRSPSTRIIVTGCYAQRDPAELAALSNVSYVVGNSHKSMVGVLAKQVLSDPLGEGRAQIFCSDIFEQRQLESTSHQGSGGRTRATVKVQDGCNARCSFCVIPFVRGRSRSLPLADLIEQVGSLVERGYREVVLSGIHLGHYGRDLSPSLSLEELIHSVLHDVRSLERLRLSSIEPLEVTKTLIESMAVTEKIAEHFHVPMQSGSSRILREMGRPYDSSYYADLLSRIRECLPNASIGADVMVGFPGETDDDFMQTYDLISRSPLTYLHVFPYSARPGTVASTLPNRIPEHVAQFRGSMLRKLIGEKNVRFRRSFIGRKVPVLVFDEGAESGWRQGITDNFIKTQVPASLEPNRWHRVEVSALDAGGFQVSNMTTAAETA